MDLFNDYGLPKAKKSAYIFNSLFPGKTFLDIIYDKPSDYVRVYMNEYSKLDKKNNSLNGKIFELIIYTLFIRESIAPLYIQAKVAFIPNVDYDLLIFNNEFGPISISLKTSIR